MTGFVGGNFLPIWFKEAYLRDLKILKKIINFNQIDLRIHPRETGNWPIKLKNFLNLNNLNVKICLPDQSLSEIAHDYIAVAGGASGALREIHAIDPNKKIICFEKISKIRFQNPKLYFASNYGIDWINEDGTFDDKSKKMFQYQESDYFSFSDIVLNILNT